MKNRTSISLVSLLAIAGFIAAFMGCTGGGGGKGGGYLILNMISNPSFELGGAPSLALWYPSDTTSHLHFSSDAASGCGNYSVVLTPSGDSSTYNLTYSILHLNEESRPSTMSVWAKAISGAGTFSLSIFHPQKIEYIQGPMITDTAWHRYTLAIADSIPYLPDSIVAYLTATAPRGTTGKVYFDSCAVVDYIFIPPEPGATRNRSAENPIQ